MTKQEMQKFMDKLDQTLVAVRDSTSPSISQAIFTMTEKLDLHIQTHEEDIKDLKRDIAVLKKSVEPAVSAIDTANTMKRVVTWLAGFIIASGVIFSAIKLLKDWIKS